MADNIKIEEPQKNGGSEKQYNQVPLEGTGNESPETPGYDAIKERLPNSKEQPEQNTNEQKSNSVVQEEPAELILKRQLQETEAKYKEINDKYLRLYSEFDNFRKRTAKEKIDWFRSAGEDVVRSQLTVLDDFERAIKHNESVVETGALKEGILLIYQKMKNLLIAKGLKEMEVSPGADFNTDLHEAITKIAATDEKLKGKVVDVVEKGYYLNDKVIRYAKVVIGE